MTVGSCGLKASAVTNGLRQFVLCGAISIGWFVLRGKIMNNVMEQDIKKVLISEEEIRERVAEIGARISEDYAGKNLLMVGILKGSVVFMADLMRAVTTHARIDFMSVSSYGSGTKSSGVVKIVKDLDNNVEGYDLLLVEDILDSGLTLSYLRELLRDRHPNSIKIVTLLNKPARRTADIQPDYCCFEVPDEFVVGYGLDFDERYRNLPYVGVLKEEVYQG